MLTLFFYALVNLAALWGMAAGKPNAIRWLAALTCLAVPLMGLNAYDFEMASQGSEPSSDLSLIYLFSAYGALILLCVYLIIKGRRTNRTSHAYLGGVMLTITLLLCLFGYALSQANWKVGG